jgi:hypothetical protein
MNIAMQQFHDSLKVAIILPAASPLLNLCLRLTFGAKR